MGGPEIFGGGFYGVIRRAIVIGNGFAGSENQSIGLVRALGLSNHQSLFRVTRPRGGIHERLHWLPVSLHKKLDYVMKQFQTVRGKKLIPLSAEKCGLSDILEADAKHISKMARETFEMDGPLLVVASGRDTISVASYIKQLAPENVFVVQVLTVGALHQADSAALRSAASAWHDKLASLPRPLLVVNIGGPASSCRYGADLAKQLTVLLQNVLWSCGSLRISFSRRTPEKVSKILVRELGNHPKVYIWNGEEPNPHMGHLSWADAFVITADSVSMLSEACSTGKPVYVIGAEHCKWKFADFHKSLLERGVVRPFTGKENISESWSYSPLNGTAEAASRVHVALAERGWKVQS
eukprot:XP_010654122.1 PREDICTED: mitochondrial fission protein ELM1 isoform X3 [Vitis vinifera]